MAIQKSKVGIKKRENKRGDTFSFRFRYEGKTITRTVGYSEEEALTVGEEIQDRLLAGKIKFDDISPEYVEQAKHELAIKTEKIDTAKAEKKEQRAAEKEDAPRAEVELSSSQAADVDAREEPAEKTLSTSIKEAKEPPTPVAVSSDSQPLTAKKPASKRKKKQEIKDYYPPYVPLVTNCFQFPLSNGDAIQLLDAYLISLTYYCERYKAEKACTFSASTIAGKINVSRYSVLRSVDKLVKNKIISKQVVNGKQWKLTIQSSQILPLIRTNGDISCNLQPLNGKTSCNLQPLNGKTSCNLQHDINNIYKTEQQNSVVVASFSDSQNKSENVLDSRLSTCVKLWESADGFGKPITPNDVQILATLLDDFSFPRVLEVLAYTCERYQNGETITAPIRYISATLEKKQNSRPLKSSAARIISQSQEETEQERAERLAREQRELDAIGNPFDD